MKTQYSSNQEIMKIVEHLKQKLQDFSCNPNWEFDKYVKNTCNCSISTMRIA